LIHHSDKGAQYTALRFTQRLVDAGVAPSTGSTGDSLLTGQSGGSFNHNMQWPIGRLTPIIRAGGVPNLRLAG
jgi:transposase InsO family protein